MLFLKKKTHNLILVIWYSWKLMNFFNENNFVKLIITFFSINLILLIAKFNIKPN